MQIRLGYNIGFELPRPVAMVAMLSLHPSRAQDAVTPDVLHVTGPGGEAIPQDLYVDAFGNRCSRFLAPAGALALMDEFLINDPGVPDIVVPDARQVPVAELPTDTLRFLLASRYCEMDHMQPIADELFGHIEGGWAKVQAVCDWVQWKLAFAYGSSRPTKTAIDAYIERVGVCRDFQHLAITFCRCLNIPARYATGYLGDIGLPAAPTPMDFSAWFEAFVGDRWYAFDARHNTPRLGRTLMAVGRDAADVAMTTAFGVANLTRFEVISEEVTV